MPGKREYEGPWWARLIGKLLLAAVFALLLRYPFGWAWTPAIVVGTIAAFGLWWFLVDLDWNSSSHGGGSGGGGLWD